MKRGTTAALKFQFDVDLGCVNEIIFSFCKELKETVNPTLVKRYPQDGVLKYGALYLYLTQEETLLFEGRTYIECQLNLANGSVIKTDIISKVVKSTLFTSIVDGNVASADTTEIINVSVDEAVEIVNSSGGGISRSIESISKSETNGLVDTYKICYTDGTDTVFYVTNGKDGKDGLDGRSATLPKLFLEGDTDGISKSNSVNMVVEYVSEEINFTDECTLKWQGTSSLSYPKKNFTMKLSNKIDLGFGKQKKYCLKANYIDHSHARNIVSARLWAEIVANRTNYEQLPEELRNSPNNGAIDGYPIKLYLNGNYEGIYTLNIPKDAWMFGMDDTKNEHCVLCGENYVSGCFRAEAKIDGTDWSDEIHDEVPATILTKWNEVISFVMNSTDEDFKANIDNYIDLESLIDYYIFAYVSCGLDSMGKNQIYCTYDGQKWYASMYDMDSTWGLYWNGASFVSTEYRCQEDYETMVDSREGNLLFERLFELFNQEIATRYKELRNDILSIKNIICKFEDFTDLISSDLYAEDVEIYTGIPSQTTNNIKQIRTYAKNRLTYVDNNIEKIGLTSILLSITSILCVGSKVKLKTTFEPTNANDYELSYESDNTEIATVDENGIVTGVTEGTVNVIVTDNKTGLTNSLEITVNAESDETEVENLVFKLDSSSIEDGVIADFEKDGVSYPVTTNGILSVDESDNGIVFDGTQTFMITTGNAEVGWDNPRSIAIKFMTTANSNSQKNHNILSHAAGDAVSDGKMKWGAGHTGFYYKDLGNEGRLLGDVGTTSLIPSSNNVALYPSTIHTLVSVYDKDNSKYQIYLDGVLVGETTSIGSAGIKSCSYIGNTEGSVPFVGKIYELSLYDKALTEEEIASL